MKIKLTELVVPKVKLHISAGIDLASKDFSSKNPDFKAYKDHEKYYINKKDYMIQ